jgi:transcriptional regulator with GAF, ATPase, and Fis domain
LHRGAGLAPGVSRVGYAKGKDVMNKSERQSREVRELHLLFEISTKLSESLDLKAVLEPILQMTAEHMGIIRGTLTILNRKKGEIVIEESYGLRPEEEAKGKYLMGEGITGRVIDTGQAAIVPRIADEPLFLDKTGSRRHLDKGDIAFICVPIKAGTETIGAISADRPSGEKTALGEDVRLLTIERIWLIMKAEYFVNIHCSNKAALIERADQALCALMDDPKKTVSAVLSAPPRGLLR